MIGSVQSIPALQQPAMPNVQNEDGPKTFEVAIDEPSAPAKSKKEKIAESDQRYMQSLRNDILAHQKKIEFKEMFAALERERLAEYPGHIANAKAQLAAETDPVKAHELGERLSAFQTSYASTKARMEVFEREWPQQRAAYIERIAQLEASLETFMMEKGAA